MLVSLALLACVGNLAALLTLSARREPAGPSDRLGLDEINVEANMSCSGQRWIRRTEALEGACYAAQAVRCSHAG